jgi:hypothetical protein
MKTLVIHPYDYTTRFLTVIHEDHDDWTVITEDVSHKFLKEQIKKHDRIIMLGHGTGWGLLGFNRFVIDSSLVYLLREKDCVCIWCNANEFVEKYGLKGFYTGMIISEMDEAYMCSVKVSVEELEAANWLFAEAIQHSIDEPNMLEKAHSIFIGDGEVHEFNKSNMYYG